jgi:choline dehydrogenase-like flavoprotein
VHGVEGLTIADASIIPSSIGVNPMETIVALSLRCAERWSEDLSRRRLRVPSTAGGAYSGATTRDEQGAAAGAAKVAASLDVAIATL